MWWESEGVREWEKRGRDHQSTVACRRRLAMRVDSFLKNKNKIIIKKEEKKWDEEKRMKGRRRHATGSGDGDCWRWEVVWRRKGKEKKKEEKNNNKINEDWVELWNMREEEQCRPLFGYPEGAGYFIWEWGTPSRGSKLLRRVARKWPPCHGGGWERLFCEKGNNGVARERDG